MAINLQNVKTNKPFGGSPTGEALPAGGGMKDIDPGTGVDGADKIVNKTDGDGGGLGGLIEGLFKSASDEFGKDSGRAAGLDYMGNFNSQSFLNANLSGDNGGLSGLAKKIGSLMGMVGG